MDQVQGWLSSGSNGREKPEKDQDHKEDKIIKGLVEKLNQKDGQENVKPGGGIQPYLDDLIDQLNAKGIPTSDRGLYYETDGTWWKCLTNRDECSDAFRCHFLGDCGVDNPYNKECDFVFKTADPTNRRFIRKSWPKEFSINPIGPGSLWEPMPWPPVPQQ